MSKCLRWAAAGKGNVPDRPSATSERWGNRGEELGYVDLAKTLILTLMMCVLWASLVDDV